MTITFEFVILEVNWTTISVIKMRPFCLQSMSHVQNLAYNWAQIYISNVNMASSRLHKKGVLTTKKIIAEEN